MVKRLQTFLNEDGSYRYSIMAPDFVVDREERPHYEKDRFASMEANLKYGDILFDVGTELGWQSAIYATFVGPGNMCLFEHTPELWPTVKETWHANFLTPPFRTYCGFVSNRTFGLPTTGIYLWPDKAEKEALKDFSTWSKIHADSSGPELALDSLLLQNLRPAAMTIDVEGSEYRVLRGAQKILRDVRPLVWLSIHPAQRLATFNTSRQEIIQFLTSLGYGFQYLGVDHEEHYFFYPVERLGSVVFVESPWRTNGKRDVLFEEAIPDWKDVDGMPYAKSWGSDE